MNLLKPIDYIIYKIYRILWPDDISSVASFAVLLILNHTTVIIWTLPAYYNSKVFLSLSLGVYIFLSFYYNESRFLKIEERYKNEPPKQKLWGSIVVIAYGIATFVLLFCAIAYRNKLNGF